MAPEMIGHTAAGFVRWRRCGAEALGPDNLTSSTPNAVTGCAVKALVHSGGIPARELVRSTR
jgi:hypothetical protein